MLTTRSMIVAGLTLLAASCASPDLAAPPPAPEAAPEVPAPPLEAISSIVEGLGGELLTRGLEAVGFFDAIGLGTPDDQTAVKVAELTAKLDAMSAQLESVKQSIDARILTAVAEQAISDQTSAFGLCLRTLLNLRDVSVTSPASLQERNNNLRLRAYQVAGLALPSGESLPDPDCALGIPLARLQSTIVSSATPADQDHFLAALARQSRQQGLGFESVARYFNWVVGVQRRALELMAQAHRRLGKDEFLVGKVAQMQQSLRLQGIELLRAAEVYAATAPPGATGPAFADPDAAAALAMADRVVGLLEGRTWLVTVSVITPPLEAHAPGAVTVFPYAVERGLPLDDVLSAMDEHGAVQTLSLIHI